MSTANEDYSAPAVSEYSLDSGGNYVSPASWGSEDSEGSGTLSASIIE